MKVHMQEHNNEPNLCRYLNIYMHVMKILLEDGSIRKEEVRGQASSERIAITKDSELSFRCGSRCTHVNTEVEGQVEAKEKNKTKRVHPKGIWRIATIYCRSRIL